MRWFGYLLYRLARPEIRRRMNGSSRARVLIVAGDELLLVKGWISRQRWMLPGGGIESHEDVAAAARRELAEELGLDISLKDFKSLKNLEYQDDHRIKWQACLLLVRFEQKPKLKRRRLELSDANWVPINQLPPKRSPLVDTAIEVWQKAT